MKNKASIFFLSVFALVGLYAAGSGFNQPEEAMLGVGGIYAPSITSDTLTNTEKDTFNFPQSTLSLYTYCVQPVVTQLSGTAGVKAYLDQSTASTGTNNWFTIDSTASLTNASPRGILDGTDLLGRRYRLRFVGTGTASVKYDCTVICKKKN